MSGTSSLKRAVRPLARAAAVAACLGASAVVLGIWSAPDRVWYSALLAVNYAMGLSMAAVCFLAIQQISGGRWSLRIDAIPEAMAGAVPGLSLLTGAVLIAGLWHYPWTQAHGDGAHALTGFKAAWLSPGFFALRTVVYLVSWSLFARGLVRASRQRRGALASSSAPPSRRLAAGFLVWFGYSFWLASYDWLMSLEPEWYSTIYGVYNFAGAFAGGLAAISLLAIHLERRGPLQGILSRAHLHDLGKLLFGFSTFWMYVWFSQYMLIWYANLPEETAYFVRRLQGPWASLFYLNLLLNWVIPFFALLSRRVKQSPEAMGRVCVVVLLGRWLDLLLMVVPARQGAVLSSTAWDLVVTAGAVGVYGLLLIRSLLSGAPGEPGDAEANAGHRRSA